MFQRVCGFRSSGPFRVGPEDSLRGVWRGGLLQTGQVARSEEWSTPVRFFQAKIQLLQSESHFSTNFNRNKWGIFEFVRE